jgi:hypothetical protein
MRIVFCGRPYGRRVCCNDDVETIDLNAAVYRRTAGVPKGSQTSCPLLQVCFS